jgi:hypothetical protein
MTQPDLAVHTDQLKDGTAFCPFCEKGSGRLFSVALKGPTRTLTYQCADCKQLWPVSDHYPGLHDPPSNPQEQ